MRGTAMSKSIRLAVVLAVAAPACSRGGDDADAGPSEAVIEAVDCGVGDRPARVAPTVEPPGAIPTELTIDELRAGTGRPAAAGDTLYVDHVGIRSDDGTVIDSSYDRAVPTDFVLGRGRVVSGWDQGLVGARAGSMLRLDVPARLAYGNSPPGPPILPGDALSYLIEVRAVVAPTTAADAPLDVDVDPSTGALDLTTSDLAVGDGTAATMGSTAIVHVLLVRGDDTSVLLDTWADDRPLVVELSDPPAVMPGLVQGLQCMRVGGRRVITVPPTWAFGEDGDPDLGLPADTDLVVVADLVGVY